MGARIQQPSGCLWSLRIQCGYQGMHYLSLADAGHPQYQLRLDGWSQPLHTLNIDILTATLR